MILFSEGRLDNQNKPVKGRAGLNGLESEQNEGAVVVYLRRFGYRERYWSFWKEGETWGEARGKAENIVRAMLTLGDGE